MVLTNSLQYEVNRTEYLFVLCIFWTQFVFTWTKIIGFFHRQDMAQSCKAISGRLVSRYRTLLNREQGRRRRTLHRQNDRKVRTRRVTMHSMTLLLEQITTNRLRPLSVPLLTYSSSSWTMQNTEVRSCLWRSHLSPRCGLILMRRPGEIFLRRLSLTASFTTNKTFQRSKLPVGACLHFRKKIIRFLCAGLIN